MVTSGATTKRIDRLEAQQLTTRRISSDDGRSRLVALTDRGRALVDDLIHVHLDNERVLVSALAVERRTLLAELLAEMLATLVTVIEPAETR